MGNQKITVDVDINGHIKGFNQAIQQANAALAKMPLIKDNPLAKALEKAKTAMGDLNKVASKGISSASDKNALTRAYENVEKAIQNVVKAQEDMAKMPLKDFRKLIDENLINGFEDAKKAIEEYKSAYESLAKQRQSINGKQGAETRRQKQIATLEAKDNRTEAETKKLEELRGKSEKAKAEIEQLKLALEGDLNNVLSTLKQKLSDLGIDTTGITDVKTALAAVEDQLVDTEKIVEESQASFQNTNFSIEELVKTLEDAGYTVNKAGDDFERAKDQLDLSNTIANNIKNFFSLTNAIYLFRRAIMSSFNTVKELDAVMTETAVVTDFSVSDMWDKLPEYTKMANELGATTKGAYETATLYYQQGLKTNEVMAVSAETMKMARIAGLDYATATDYMTAALRGFNMEINIDSAQRVNDVYSRLAAITASNTQEISVAMTKVASLAHNANMEFETTAAFLAQIIETTRESAETAGTALKTVVARFTEVKKLYNEGELMGTDEEGEEIDVNKVATALRSAGIDMNKYFTGMVGLDDIFMELASKWDSLDKVQQRYIATMAAGSRQQSRFIAMMSNYKRTLQLVGEAQDSAGASQKQFDKTMESLEAKLNRLKNAWDTFLMSIANSDAIKWAIDLATELITKLNELVTTLSGDNAWIKFFTTIGTILGGSGLIKGGLKALSGELATILKQGKKLEGQTEKTTGVLSGMVKASEKIANIKLGNVFKKIGDSITSLGENIISLLTNIKTFIVANWEILAVLAAVAVAIWAVVKAFEAYKKTTPEYKAEKLTEDLEDTKEKLETLEGYIDSIQQKELDLNDKIKGTKEWKESLYELNEEVRALLELYPQLSKYITVKDGKYVIDWEGIEGEKQKVQAQAIKTQQAQYFQDYEAAQQNLPSFNSLRSKFSGIGFNVGTSSFGNEQWKALLENPSFYNSKERLESLGITGLTEEQFEKEVLPIIESLQQQVDEANLKRDLAYQSINSYMSPEDYEQAIEEKVEELKNNYDKAGIKELGKEIFGEDSWGDLSKGYNYDEMVRAIAEVFAGEFDINKANLGEGKEKNIARLAYENQKNSMDALQQQQYSTNLNAIQGAGIEFTDDIFRQAADYTKEGKDIQELIDSLLKLLDVENTHEENVKNLKDTYEALDKEFSDDTIDKVTQKWEQDEKELLNLQKVLQETPDDYEAVAKAASEALDTDFDAEDVEKYSDYLQQIAAGGEDANDALVELQSLIAQDFLADLGVDFDTVGGWIEEINGREVKIGGTADFTEIYAQLMTLLMESGKTFEDANTLAEQYFQKMGYEMQYEDMPTDHVDIPELSGVGAALGGVAVGVKRIPLNRKRVTWVRTGYNPTGSSGGGPKSPSSSDGGGGGGGGSDSNPDRWLNPYDKFYNLTEQINEALRQREKLERNYDRILKNRWSKQRDIQANTQARLNSLKQEIAMNKALLAGRQSQVDAVLNEKFLDDDKNIRTFREFGVGRYANYNTERGTIEIDWEGLERLSGTTDTQLGGVIEDYVSRLEELQKQFEDVDKTIEDLEDEVAEILDINKEEYLSFEQRVFEAIIDRQQKLIDNYSELSDTISNNDEEVLNALSESIDLSRQIRDNTKTEEEIAQKEARLAYLRRDTSGANDLAIKQLEKELEEARQSYGDTLVDQELDRLSQASEEAAKQRERQIEIMEKQLEWQQRVGFFWPEVIDLLQNNYGELDEGISNALMDLLKNTDAFRGMSEYQQANWAQELHEQWLQSESGLASWRLSEAKAASLGKEGNESNYSIAANQTTAGKALRYDYNRDIWMDEDEGWYTGVSYDATSNQFIYESYSSKASRDEEEAKKTAAAQAAQAKRNVTVGSYINAGNAPIYTSAYGGSPLHQYFSDDPKYLVLDDYGSSWMVRWHGLSSGITGFFRKGDVRAYKTGGLVDYTGPAWLDGTPSRPEFVLNADQTQAFMKLVDKLGSGAGAGDNYFDINIVVDELSSDYDVDKMVDRIKQKITEDAQYRNVNAINWIR